jgi:hypothetical protein
VRRSRSGLGDAGGRESVSALEDRSGVIDSFDLADRSPIAVECRTRTPALQMPAVVSADPTLVSGCSRGTIRSVRPTRK